MFREFCSVYYIMFGGFWYFKALFRKPTEKGFVHGIYWEDRLERGSLSGVRRLMEDFE